MVSVTMRRKTPYAARERGADAIFLLSTAKKTGYAGTDRTLPGMMAEVRDAPGPGGRPQGERTGRHSRRSSRSLSDAVIGLDGAWR